MKFKKLNGFVNKNSAYLSIEIEGGDSRNSIGDEVWFSEDGRILQIDSQCSDEVLEEVIGLFEPSSRRAVRGAFIKMSE